MSIDWTEYSTGNFYDELIADDCSPREPATRLINYLASLSTAEINKRKEMAESTIQEMGVSFTVYTEEGNIDQIGRASCRERC